MKKLKFKIYTKLNNNKVFAFIVLLFCVNMVFAQQPGAYKLKEYLPLLKDKKVGLVVNQTSEINHTHLVDTLKKLGVNITLIFAPEHGFRGDHSAGEKVKSGVDAITKLPVYSLYGSNKKPTEAQINKADIFIFDIQDVGARFYTYISTLHYVMEACAENNKTLIILDRPNPNGHYTDGPVLDTNFRSFVGMHPVPIVHGLTIAEYAKMINGEGWLNNKIKCNLNIVTCKGYTHQSSYNLPVKPSPNLPNMASIYLYPSLCLFEGTDYSLGRGTDFPFMCIGKPGCKIGNFTFTPISIPGIADNPPHEGKLCTGFLLTDFGKNAAYNQKKINLFWLMELYKADTNKSKYFNNFFDKLAGTDQLRKQIIAGNSEEQIRKTWQHALNRYRVIRKKYLLYADEN